MYEVKEKEIGIGYEFYMRELNRLIKALRGELGK
jgi:hypothetical protein